MIACVGTSLSPHSYNVFACKLAIDIHKWVGPRWGSHCLKLLQGANTWCHRNVGSAVRLGTRAELCSACLQDPRPRKETAPTRHLHNTEWAIPENTTWNPGGFDLYPTTVTHFYSGYLYIGSTLYFLEFVRTWLLLSSDFNSGIIDQLAIRRDSGLDDVTRTNLANSLRSSSQNQVTLF